MQPNLIKIWACGNKFKAIPLNISMNKQTLFKIYDKVNSALGFANVNCLEGKCNFCETGIDAAILFPFEEEYLKIKNNTKIPSEKSNCISIKTLGIDNNSCIFYKNRKCVIQEYKPLECKLYPLIIWEGYKFVNLELDLRCPEATKLKENKEYFKQIIPALREFVNFCQKNFFLLEEICPPTWELKRLKK
jgi:Fe-S-cluster containining protein